MGWQEGSLEVQKKELDEIARSEGRFGDKSLMVAGIQKEINKELAARNRILLASNQLIEAGYTQAQQVRALRKLDASSADLPPGWGSSKRWKYEKQLKKGDIPLDQLRRLPGGFTPGRTARFQQVMGREPAVNVSGFGSWSKKIETSLKKNEKNTRTTAQKQKAIPPTIPSTRFEDGTVGPRQAGGFGRGQDPTFGAFSRFGGKKGIFGMSGAQRYSGAVSSAAIGGGFPLLFGQGPVAAVGGGVGGALGGALGGGFGFGASIVGTLIGTKVQEVMDFRKGIEGLNTSIKATGGTSVFTAKSISKLAKQMGLSKQEALQAAKSFSQFEAAGRSALLSTFGNEAVFNFAQGLETNAAIMSGMVQMSKDLSLEQAKIIRQTFLTKGIRAAEAKYIEFIFQKQKSIQLERAKPNMWNPLNWGPHRRGRRQRITEGKREEVEASSVEDQKLAKIKFERWNKFNETNKEIAAFKAPEDELNKLLDSTTQIVNMADAMGNSFSNSFMEVIKGSMSMRDAMGSMLRSIADEFMSMAAKIIAAQVKMDIVGAFAPGGWFGGQKKTTSSFVPQGGWSNFGSVDFGGKKAGGGPVSGGQSYLVGEKGPELFVPRSHGNIVPNNAMGGTNIVVNVDASGSSAEADGDEQRQLGNLVGAAVQAEIVRQQRPGGLLQGVR